MTEEDTLAFIGASIRSVWAVELLALLRRQPEKAWQAGALVRELRSSDVLIGEALGSLRGAGLVAEEPGDGFRYGPASTALDALAARIVTLYAAKPVAVVRAITAAPNEKLRIFSDAFRLKD